MGIKEATIYLDSQFNTYYPGQTINGRIEYTFDSPKKVRGEFIITNIFAMTHCMSLWYNDEAFDSANYFITIFIVNLITF